MPALNFSAQFAPLVESKQKRQTIRAKRRHPIKPSDTLYLYTGMRTKACRRLLDPTPCESVCDIVIGNWTEITAKGQVTITVFVATPHFYAVGLEDMTPFAQADGFKDAASFLAWFGISQTKWSPPFIGQLIQW